MASGCGSRGPHLDTAFMDSPLVLTSELRPPAASKRTASNIFRSVETREERGSYGASGALLTYFHLDVDLVLRNEPREALSMGADVQKEPTSSREKKKIESRNILAFFRQIPDTVKETTGPAGGTQKGEYWGGPTNDRAAACRRRPRR